VIAIIGTSVVVGASIVTVLIHFLLCERYVVDQWRAIRSGCEDLRRKPKQNAALMESERRV